MTESTQHPAGWHDLRDLVEDLILDGDLSNNYDLDDPGHAEDTKRDNRMRAGWAGLGVLAFAERCFGTDEGLETVVGDLLTDLRHLCDVYGLEFDALADRSLRNYLPEVEGIF